MAEVKTSQAQMRQEMLQVQVLSFTPHLCWTIESGGWARRTKEWVVGMLRVWRKRGESQFLCPETALFPVPITIRSESLFLFVRLSLSHFLSLFAQTRTTLQHCSNYR